MNNLVSIIMPLHNTEDFVVQSVNSVINQTYSQWELLIIDDCSTDDSVKKVKEFQDVDDRISLFENKINLGAAKTRNYGIKKAKGRFIAFLDSDDQWDSSKLEKQISFMIKNNYDLTYTYYRHVDETGKFKMNIVDIPRQLAYKSLLKKNYIGCLTAVYDSNSLGKIYMPDILKRQDFALWLKILKKVDYAYCYNEILASYTLRGGSVSSNKFKLIKYNWNLYRNVEKFSIPKSSFFLASNIYFKILKK